MNRYKYVHIQPPYGKIAQNALIFLLLFIIISETVSRTGILKPRLSTFGIGTSDYTFEVQLDRIKTRIEKEGYVDCIFLGSSRVLDDINPDTVGKMYLETAGQFIRCQNFGITGLGITGAAKIANILTRLYRPRLIVVGTQFLDIQFQDVDNRILNDPWVRYSTGEFNFDGWLIDHSLAFRYYMDEIRYLSIGDNKANQDEGIPDQILQNGYLPLGLSTDPLRNLPWELHSKYEIPVDSREAVKELLALRKEDVQILFIEMPIRYDRYKSSVYNFNDEHIFKKETTQLLSKSSSAIWFTQDLNLVPINDWHESEHMNSTGAEIFSAWIGNQLGTAVEKGTLVIPARSIVNQ